ncbi:FAD-dependent oxidoreductase [Okibacterium fritillariae]|uniref:FAD dependent oxidoreductase n=1 Tax=Okibacterium fritillariae TaxID=123320 RepID=A0A1T5IES6_9MICO|nr:FAD-dependent oxidoreductase [Okibacterium fritillariae]SKC37696.1 FAD dependent oxidoreductase [Okibacterium fritillariae]
MQSRTESSDVVVIGGGLAGVSAAVAAARLGSRVSLITNRPVLGGNSSSEIRVWVVGATAHGHQRFARETGIMGELFLENQYRNAEGNPYYWDQTVLDLVRAEPNIHLHLNTDVRTTVMRDATPTAAPAATLDAAPAAAPDSARAAAPAIEAVIGWTMGSEIETRFEAPIFIDCTGDGLIGAQAGATYRIGREARSEYNEPWAPLEADDELLGSSIFFYTKDAGRPERFVPPSIAIDIAQTPILANRIIRTGDNGCNYWWIEWGGELDTVGDNERIRDELWGVVFGIWNHIKNSGEFDADTLTLEWVGAIPGKREYRRFVGDHTLTQHDILDQVRFDDAVAFGGWSIDLHPVEGVYADKPGAQQRFSDGTYDIPFRSLYSRDVSNLLFAGRNISASHVAFGSTRVMATCSTQGQAVGTAAALAARLDVTPRELGSRHLDVLQGTLLREDAPVIGVRADDADDLMHTATLTASSTLTHLSTVPHAGANTTLPLDRDVALVIPIEPRLDDITFRADASADTTVTVELWGTGKPQNYAPIVPLDTRTVAVTAGRSIPIAARFDWLPDDPQNAVVVVRANPDIALHLAKERPYGVLALTAKHASDESLDDHIPEEGDQPVTDWTARMLRRRSFVATVSPATTAYSPAHLTDGLQRPFGGPHLWSSAPLDPTRDLVTHPETVEATWSEPVTIRSVRIVFNDDVDEDLVNLHHHRTEFEVIPELVSDYAVEARTATGEWMPVAEVSGNRHRHRVHDIDAVTTDGLRLVVRGTNGSPYVTVVALKAYSAPSGRAGDAWVG